LKNDDLQVTQLRKREFLNEETIKRMNAKRAVTRDREERENSKSVKRIFPRNQAKQKHQNALKV